MDFRAIPSILCPLAQLPEAAPRQSLFRGSFTHCQALCLSLSNSEADCLHTEPPPTLPLQEPSFLYVLLMGNNVWDGPSQGECLLMLGSW